jgi:NADPH:quinone reductase-like Zn-dependent oxidoreductase
MALPTITKALVLRKVKKQPFKPVYHNAVVETQPIPALEEGQVLVKIGAAAFNHREVRARAIGPP